MTGDISHTPAYRRTLDFIREKELFQRFLGGVTVGFSGGADSVFLLLVLKNLSEKNKFPLYAFHVHHGIRGEEADRDLEFCRVFCEEQKISFSSVRVDAPLYAQNTKMGIEEAARELRYQAFLGFAKEMHCSAVLTAHHADDNLETVLFHLLRGSGIRGMTGIPVTRGLFVRPLLAVGRADIVSALNTVGISFMEDSTNEDTAYVRNDLRKNVLPVLYRLVPHPELAVLRMTQSLRSDMEYLDGEANRIYKEVVQDGKISRSFFANLPSAIASRIFFRMAAEYAPEAPVPQEPHVKEALALAKSERTAFRFSIPGGIAFVGDRHALFFIENGEGKESPSDHTVPLRFPETLTPDGVLLFVFSEEREKFVVRGGNVYKFLKQIQLSRDTMESEIFLRRRRNGDRYTYGGMTHSLRKLLIDQKYTEKEKDALWILSDEKGIIWTPCGSVRDGERTDPSAKITVYMRDKSTQKQ